MINFDYKIYNMCDVLTKNEYSEVESLVEDFIIDLNKL